MLMDGLRRENSKLTAETMVVAVRPMIQALMVFAGMSSS
jgi:hypothetical protein